MSLKDDEKLIFFEGLGEAVSSGIPFVDAVSGFQEDASPRLKVVLNTLKADVENGKTIYESLIKYPQVFDGVTLSLINSGEESGNLDVAFETIAKNLAEEVTFKNKVKNALTYPLLLGVVFVVMVTFIMVYAVPKFKYVFSRMSAEIPLPTKVVFFVSDAIINYYLYIIASVVLLTVLITFLLKKFRNQFLQLVFSLPLLSTLYNYLDIYRFSKTLALLINSGIPLTQSLELCQTTVFKTANVKRLKDLTAHCLTGKEMALFFKADKKFLPQTMINLIEFGEKSGSLEKSFQKISTYTQTRVQTTLDRISVLLEPITITAMGLTVGGVMMSIIAPIYQLIGNINAR
jgi:type II secretory pathway component PulF